MRWSDVDEGKGLLYVRHSKNGEGRPLPINRLVLDVFRRCLSVDQVVEGKGEYVFRNGKGERLGEVRRCFQRALKRAGISDFRFHDLRHCFAAHLASNGVDVMVLKELMGHKTLAMTLRYAHLFPDRGKKAVEMLAGAWGAGGR